MEGNVKLLKLACVRLDLQEKIAKQVSLCTIICLRNRKYFNVPLKKTYFFIFFARGGSFSPLFISLTQQTPNSCGSRKMTHKNSARIRQTTESRHNKRPIGRWQIKKYTGHFHKNQAPKYVKEAKTLTKAKADIKKYCKTLPIQKTKREFKL